MSDWLSYTDRARAWNQMLGHRIKAARERLAAEQRATFKGPKRGPDSLWADFDRFSQAAVAAALHRGQSWLSKIEKGVRAITVHDVHEIAEALGIPASELLAPPNKNELARIADVLKDVANERKKANITPATVERLRDESYSGRPRSTPRSPREEERLQATRGLAKAPPSSKSGRKKNSAVKPPKKRTR